LDMESQDFLQRHSRITRQNLELPRYADFPQFIRAV
jgi:hypothetical protein